MDEVVYQCQCGKEHVIGPEHLNRTLKCDECEHLMKINSRGENVINRPVMDKKERARKREKQYAANTAASQANSALICGIVGFFICAPVMAPMAIYYSLNAKKLMNKHGVRTGDGKATAGLVLGIIQACLLVLVLIMMAVGNA